MHEMHGELNLCKNNMLRKIHFNAQQQQPNPAILFLKQKPKSRNKVEFLTFPVIRS